MGGPTKDTCPPCPQLGLSSIRPLAFWPTGVLQLQPFRKCWAHKSLLSLSLLRLPGLCDLMSQWGAPFCWEISVKKFGSRAGSSMTFSWEILLQRTKGLEY